MIGVVLLLLVDEESPTWCFGDHDESGYKHQILTLMESQILNGRLPFSRHGNPTKCPETLMNVVTNIEWHRFCRNLGSICQQNSDALYIGFTKIAPI